MSITQTTSIDELLMLTKSDDKFNARLAQLNEAEKRAVSEVRKAETLMAQAEKAMRAAQKANEDLAARINAHERKEQREDGILRTRVDQLNDRQAKIDDRIRSLSEDEASVRRRIIVVQAREAEAAKLHQEGTQIHEQAEKRRKRAELLFTSLKAVMIEHGALLNNVMKGVGDA
jgi:chromosome segregation ATPase